MTPHSVFEDSKPSTYRIYLLDPFEYFGVPLTRTLPAMENISQRFGALGIRKIAAIEALPLEIPEKIFSYLPRDERLAASSCSRKIRRFHEEFTWKSIHVDIGDSLEFAGRTE